MPEGDAIHRAARRLQVLVGQELEVETPHPRAAIKQLAPKLHGRRLESVEAIGKNLLFHFEGGLVLRSHLRMSGRWRVLGRGAPVFGTPWLVLRGDEHAGVLWGGPVLELDRGIALRLGPDILADPPDYDAMLARLRLERQEREMRARVQDVQHRANIYRRKGHMCPRCGTPIKSWPQGDDARMAYWCPQCQRGEEPKTA